MVGRMWLLNNFWGISKLTCKIDFPKLLHMATESPGDKWAF